MFRTLFGKLAAVLHALFLLLAAIAILGALYFFNMYGEEAQQRMNESLARHLSEHNGLSARRNVDPQMLQGLFDTQMIINPEIQIYLLDSAGRVIACSDDLERLKSRPVDLKPIQAFLSGSGKLPLYGDDPRDPGVKRIFSAAPIPASGPPTGYLYVILEPRNAQGLKMLAQSYVAQLAALLFGLCVLLALGAGLIVFAMITRKLERLADGMEQFQRSGFAVQPPLPPTPSAGAGDEIDRLSGSFREMAARMIEQVRDLKRNDVLRRELVANVSHDLKTPLASLQGYVDTLLLKDNSLSPEERRHYLLVASRSGERLSKLVADLIELARLDAREVKLSPEVFPIAELMQDVMQKFQLKAEQKRIALEIRLPKNPPYVCADIGLIERVLENLLGNAIAHTSAEGRVSMRLEADSHQARIEVTDTGCGIPEEEIPRIFERFYRVDDDQRARGDHAGLGLAITKSILDLHGTAVEVSSEPGVGTSFYFKLPVAQAGAAECTA